MRHKKALVFPGQGSQQSGMAAELYANSKLARERFDEAEEILGFAITETMFQGTVEELQQTSVTQPSIFLHSVILAEVLNLSQQAIMVAGHSLGEFSALVVSGALSFTDGLKLVSLRANAMQKACDLSPSTMAAIIGLNDEQVMHLCEGIDDVVPANFNAHGQIVISGGIPAIETAIEAAKKAGAKIARQIPVNGAFHSHYMRPAQEELGNAIKELNFKNAKIPVYQNVSAQPATHKEIIRRNLLSQLTSPVRWTQTIRNMITDGANHFIEVGPGKVLQGLIKRINRNVVLEGIDKLE